MKPHKKGFLDIPEHQKRYVVPFRWGSSPDFSLIPQGVPNLKVLKESGALSEKSLERIRAANREMGRKYVLVDKSPLIAELDGLVMKRMRGYHFS